MKFFLRAVVTGFGLALGSALFKKVSKYVGLDEDKPKDETDETVREGGGDSDLHHQYS